VPGVQVSSPASAPSGAAPLAVNSKTVVRNLNAAYVGGLSAGSLQATGGDGFTRPGTGTPIGITTERIVGMGPLPVGTYYVTGTALL
jgi:hypothetical protein